MLLSNSGPAKGLEEAGPPEEEGVGAGAEKTAGGGGEAAAGTELPEGGGTGGGAGVLETAGAAEAVATTLGLETITTTNVPVLDSFKPACSSVALSSVRILPVNISFNNEGSWP